MQKVQKSQNEMSYTGFYIRYEHEFLRNIYSKEELETSYYEVFDRFLTIVILLESTITNRGIFSETSKENVQRLEIIMKLLNR